MKQAQDGGLPGINDVQYSGRMDLKPSIENLG